MRKVTTRLENKIIQVKFALKEALMNERGDFYISDGVKVIIAVVLGALLLAAMTVLFNETILPSIKTEIESLFG